MNIQGKARIKYLGCDAGEWDHVTIVGKRDAKNKKENTRLDLLQGQMKVWSVNSHYLLNKARECHRSRYSHRMQPK